MAELYNVEVPTINEHIQKIYADHELTEDATIRNFRIVQTEGTRQGSDGTAGKAVNTGEAGLQAAGKGKTEGREHYPRPDVAGRNRRGGVGDCDDHKRD